MVDWPEMSPEERADWLNRASAAMSQMTPDQRLSIAQANAAMAATTDPSGYARLMEHVRDEYVRAVAAMPAYSATSVRGPSSIDWRRFYPYDDGIF